MAGRWPAPGKRCSHESRPKRVQGHADGSGERDRYRSDGMAMAMPPATMLLTRMTRPEASASGPPELLGAQHVGADRVGQGHAGFDRSAAGDDDAVGEDARFAPRLPRAKTSSPTRRSRWRESPRLVEAAIDAEEGEVGGRVAAHDLGGRGPSAVSAPGRAYRGRHGCS